MHSHSKSSDHASIMSSSTIAPSDYTVGPPTATFVPESSKDSKKSSKSKHKKNKKERKDNEPRLPPICLQITFA